MARSDSHHFLPSKGCALVQDTRLCFAVWPHILQALNNLKQAPGSDKAPGISIKLKSCSVLRRKGIFSDGLISGNATLTGLKTFKMAVLKI